MLARHAQIPRRRAWGHLRGRQHSSLFDLEDSDQAVGAAQSLLQIHGQVPQGVAKLRLDDVFAGQTIAEPAHPSDHLFHSLHHFLQGRRIGPRNGRWLGTWDLSSSTNFQSVRNTTADFRIGAPTNYTDANDAGGYIDDVEIYDAMAKNHSYLDIRKKIIESMPDIVGSTAYTATIYDATQVLSLAKSIDKNIITIIGGMEKDK